MTAHKGASEPPRTTPARGPREPPAPTDLDAFREHLASTVAFTDALRDRRCRRTNHFEARLGETVAVFKPLFSPWNMEVLFLLYMEGPARFNALKRKLGGVSSRVLTDKLRHLEAEGYLARREEGEATLYALLPQGHLIARHLHPLVFYLHNRDRLGDAPAGQAP